MTLNPATVRELGLSDDKLFSRCTSERLARGGPGGQHQNKTASGIRLVHRSTGLEVSAYEHREGVANRVAALHRLRLLIACSIRGGSDPDWLSPQVRRGRLACGPTAKAWPGVVACLLDGLETAGGRLAEAGIACGLSTTQLAKALTADPQVRHAADVIRGRSGWSPLRG